jgi:hypothetical protein
MMQGKSADFLIISVAMLEEAESFCTCSGQVRYFRLKRHYHVFIPALEITQTVSSNAY